MKSMTIQVIAFYSLIKSITITMIVISVLTFFLHHALSEFEDILQDVKGECSQYGRVVRIVMPRVKEGYPVQVEGNVFVQFSSILEAQVNLFIIYILSQFTIIPPSQNIYQ